MGTLTVWPIQGIDNPLVLSLLADKVRDAVADVLDDYYDIEYRHVAVEVRPASEADDDERLHYGEAIRIVARVMPAEDAHA